MKIFPCTVVHVEYLKVSYITKKWKSGYTTQQMHDINSTAIYTPVITIQTQTGSKFL